VFHQLLTTEYLFWLVALVFYLFDAIKLVSKEKILIIETLTGKFKPSFSFNTFEIKGQQVQLLNLFLPFTGYLRLNASPNQSPSSNFEKTNEDLANLQKVVLPFKVISIISFIYLLLGPVLTFYQGLGTALLLILPLHVINLLLLFVLLLACKKKIGFSYGDVTSIFFDCLVVPAYLPHIVRKIYGKKIFSCDGYYFSLKTCSESNREELEYSIFRKFKQIFDQVDEDDLRKYKTYKDLLGIKNV